MEVKFAISLLLILGYVNSQVPTSPCPGVFKYSFDNNKVFGLISAHNTVPYRHQTINVTLMLPRSSSFINVGKIQVVQDTDEVIKNILSKRPILYKINFPFSNPLPRVVNINFNGVSICHDDVADENIVTLNHTYKLTYWPTLLNRPQSTTQRYATTQNMYYTTQNYQQSIADKQSYSIHDTHIHMIPPANNYATCGVEKKFVSLIHHGIGITKGDWPWIVAVYRRRNNGDAYHCGSTLISKKSVVTAAHCVVGADKRTRPVNTLFLKLGAHDLEDSYDDGVDIRQLSKIKVHENNKEFINDIAILVMNRPATFTKYIRPVCLWSTNSDQKYVDGKEGTVVGWGADVNGNINSEPSLVHVPILSMAKCREANVQYFPLTSENTLCAGGKDGRGPCKGDSGDGLYVYENKRWTIRGLVSLSLSKTGKCDVSEYVVYTDVAKFSDWIKSSLE